MGYTEALAAAGATVLDYKEFGSYQGDWAAHVEYSGTRSIVTGSFGSCSGCDSFQAVFDYYDQPLERDGKYLDGSYREITKEEYGQQLAAYNQKLADFGKPYLDNPHTIGTIESNIAALNPDSCFDSETLEMWQWALDKMKS